MIPFKYIIEPYLQSFEYNIINQIINTNKKIHILVIKTSNKCNYCQTIDRIEHHLFYCRESQTKWDKLETWILDKLELNINITVCEILFAITFTMNEYIELIKVGI